MISLRFLIIALACTPLVACNTVGTDAPKVAAADDASTFAARLPDEPQQSSGIDRSKRPELARQTVNYRGREPPGTIVVKTGARRLYLVMENGLALRYPVAVGRAGKRWYGRAAVEDKHLKPAWSPRPEIRKDNPRLPDVIPGGTPDNPMGPAVLILRGGEYAIHGTNRASSIGTFASNGCIRMFNEDIMDLFERVRVGTAVVVTR